jgi:hypothetical protein
MNATIQICDPTAPGGQAAQQARRALDRLAGKTIGFIDNAKPNFNLLVDDLEREFVTRHGVKAVVKRRKRGASIPADESVVRELAEQCDLVITGSGD